MRLAPTPSGYLHAGNAVNFLVTQELAKASGGSVLLRIDDLNAERVRPEFVADIFDSLEWLGIEWQEGPRDAHDLARTWSQRLRLSRYHALLDTLRDGGHLYACTCSRTQLPNCTCNDRQLAFDAVESTWRLRVPKPCPVTIKEWPHGERTIDLAEAMRDPILRQRNGDPAYQIASLSDDVQFTIDLIVRGEDLLPSTACQLYIARLLGLEALTPVRFVHHALLRDEAGGKLSKSEGASSLKAMREAGEGPGKLHGMATALLAGLRPSP